MLNTILHVDTILEGDIVSSMLQVLKLVKPDWKDMQDIKMHKFTTGLTNIIFGFYHVTDPEWKDMVLVRKYGENTEKIIDRNSEKRNMLIMNLRGCGPPIYASLKNGLVYGFIPGKVCDVQSIRTEEISSLVAKEMAKMHLIDISANPDFDLGQPYFVRRAELFMSNIPQRYSDPLKQNAWLQLGLSMEELRAEFLDLQELITMHSKCPLVFCHNDLLLENLIYDEQKQKITFIDYEYGDYNYQFFDIANHFCEFAGVEHIDYSLYPSKDFQFRWFRVYISAQAELQEKPIPILSDDDLEDIYLEVSLFAVCAHFFWSMWALVQAEFSPIKFDYIDYARQRLNEFRMRKDHFLTKLSITDGH